MRNIDEHTITEAALERFDTCASPRAKQISEALVRHLHDFIREIRPTEEEWASGVDFLTRTGQRCDDKRQEFILLSDVLGVSMLVDCINHSRGDGATESTVFGPFYVNDPPKFELGANLAGGFSGDPMYVEGTVKSLDGKALANATIDVWHSDGVGGYDVQQLDQLGGAAGRGVLKSDEKGRFRFWTVRPVSYPVPVDGPVGEILKAQERDPYRPAHVHFMIGADGYERLVSQVYAADDKYIETDAVFAVKQSLVEKFVKRPTGIAPDGRTMNQPYYYLKYDFVLRPAAGRRQDPGKQKQPAGSKIAYVPN